MVRQLRRHVIDLQPGGGLAALLAAAYHLRYVGNADFEPMRNLPHAAAFVMRRQHPSTQLLRVPDSSQGTTALGLLLRREGVTVNHKKLRRLYREERLQVRRRGGRKRAIGTRAPIALPQARTERWSLDFASDTLADGR